MFFPLSLSLIHLAVKLIICTFNVNQGFLYKTLYLLELNRSFLNGQNHYWSGSTSLYFPGPFFDAVPLKGLFTPKWTFCHPLFTLHLFQTCMIFFLLFNTKKISWRMLVTKQLMVALDFHSIFFSYYGCQWLPSSVWAPTFFKTS